ncbi:MAG: hypothetical protein QOE72_3099 [Chloroflexota bacterium]|jgi:hypothetical protein|nr:hypothetical protein [Chloroflexota bacterium]
MNLADEQTFLAEVMRSEAATNTLIVGASAYLLRQLERVATDPGASEHAGRLFAMLSRANEHQLAHAHDPAKLVPAVLGLVRAAPQGRAAKDTELAVGSFVQILFGLDTWHSGGPTFKDRLVQALHATRAEALWHNGRAPEPNASLLIPSTAGHRELRPYGEIQSNPGLRRTYWLWVDRVTRTGDQTWDDVVNGFTTYLSSGS